MLKIILGFSQNLVKTEFVIFVDRSIDHALFLFVDRVIYSGFHLQDENAKNIRLIIERT